MSQMKRVAAIVEAAERVCASVNQNQINFMSHQLIRDNCDDEWVAAMDDLNQAVLDYQSSREGKSNDA